MRYVEFFTANIRNPNTLRAYARAAADLAAWCETNGLKELRDIEPVHVAAYIEDLRLRLVPPINCVELLIGQQPPDKPLDGNCHDGDCRFHDQCAGLLEAFSCSRLFESTNNQR